MAKVIPITQNPQRYSQQENEWIISASPNISPITVQKGIPIAQLHPVLTVDGVVVKAGDWYMISEGTLAALQASGNPHYAIEINGPISVKGKAVGIGKTIRIIEISIDELIGIGENLDIKNRKAGVSSVDYIWEGDTVDGIPVNLINQINYTLNPDVGRPEDKWEIHSLELGDEKTVYSVQALNTSTRQEDGSLDKAKLTTFLTDIGTRLAILQSDFNMIKDVFYNGTFPDSSVSLPFSKVATTIAEEDEFPQIFKYSQTDTIVETPATAPIPGSPAAQPPATPTETGGGDPPPPGEPATPPLPPVIQLKMRKKRDLRARVIPVWTGDPSVGDKGPRKRTIKEGETFWGYFFKNWEHGQKIWAVYEPDKTTIIGYGVADSKDFVDPV